MEKYERVLELMKSKGGTVQVDDPDLQQLLGRLIYRVAVYMSFIRRFTKLQVHAQRDGRRVVAYSLIEVNPQAEDNSRWQSSKYLQPAATDTATV
jgi:hypothetical protein